MTCCPVCKTQGSLRVVRANVTVECVAPGCHASLTIPDAALITAAIQSHYSAPAKPCTCHKPLEDAGQWALCSGCSKRICPGCAEWFDHDMRNTGECHECAALSAAAVA